MPKNSFKYVYGPVPSRRLGLSLGVDIVDFKTCNYDCIYCNLGRTTNQTLDTKEYVPISNIIDELQQKLLSDETPNFISIAGGGEPTLNSEIANLIKAIKNLTNIKIAVITNGSMLYNKEIRSSLMGANLVIPTLVAGSDAIFKKINRPHPDISFDKMIEGLKIFTKEFGGEVWLEVFLLEGINDSFDEVKKIAAIAANINPTKIQLNTATRPPADESAHVISFNKMQQIKTQFKGNVEIICDNFTPATSSKINKTISDDEILALLKRHPCTIENVATGLNISFDKAYEKINQLLNNQKIVMIKNNDKEFYKAQF